MKKGKILINVYDVIGKRLGKLEVIGYAGSRYEETAGGERKRHYYIVRCECGTVKVVQRGPILNDRVHSCGCTYERKKYHGNKNEK